MTSCFPWPSRNTDTEKEENGMSKKRLIWRRSLSAGLSVLLCLSMLPVAALAEDASPAGQEMQSSTDVSDGCTIDEDTTLQDEEENDAAVQAAQALIDALPDEATAENTEALETKLIAIDKALALLTDEQREKLDMTRYEALCEAMTTLMAEQAGEHSHPICGATCGHADSTHPDVEWTEISDLSNITAGTESNPKYYYLTNNIELTTAWNAPQYTVLDLNGYSITMQQEGDAIKVTGSFTLTDCKGSKTEYGKITHAANVNGRGVNVSEGSTFTMYGGSIYGNTATGDGGGIWADRKAVITMYGGEISDNKTTGDGGGVYLYINAALEMSGSASITGNVTTKYSGGGVCAVMGKITMSGNSSISKNTASDSSGGGVFLNGANSTLTMSDNAEIANNKAKANAAGVYMLGDDSQFTMDGGSIYGNKFTGTGACSGGGVYVNGTFNMNDGSIYNNTATESGGGVCSNGMFNMNGGNIYGNTATGNGGGVYISNGTFTMTKGTIGAVTLNRVNYDGNSAKNGGGVYINDGTFTMGTGESQTPNIYSNTASGQGGGVYVRSGQSTHFQIFNSVQVWNNGNSDVYLNDDQTIQIIGKLVGDKTIGVTPSSLPTTNPITFADGKGYTLTDNDAAPFFVNNHYGDNMYSIQLEGNHLKLYLGQPHKHTVCVGTDCTDSTHTNAFFSALSYDANTKQLVYDGIRSGNQISGDARYLYLQDDIKINETIKITENSNVTICLNGHSITSTANGDVIKIENGATLTLCDCRGGDETAKYSKITHDRTAQGRGVYVPAGATFTMYSGEISGNTLTSNSYGAGVFTEGTTTICGNAKITNNYANAPRGYGGGICTTGSLMLGGNAEITNNYVGYSNNGGGGIFAAQGSKLYISGNVKVSENMSASGSCNLYLNHNEYDTAPITVTGELADTARIGVTMVESQRPTSTNPSVNIAKAMTEGWIKDGNFVSDYNFYQMGVATLPNEQLAQLRLHDHTWGVRVKSATEANILERYCTAFTNCPSTGGTLTLTANDATFNGQSYDNARWSTDNWTGTTVPQDTPITYEEKTSENTFMKLSGAPTKAGAYRASITVDGLTATKEFKISRATHNLTASDFTVSPLTDSTYNGNPRTVTATLNAAKAQWFGEITVKYRDKDGKYVTNPTDAGTYTVVLDVAAGDGYEAQTNITCDDWKFTINQVPQELQFTYPTVNKMYGEASFTNPLKETDIQGTITYTSSNENVAKVAADGTVTILAATEGTVTITARTEGTTNYSSAEASFTLTVAKKPIDLDVTLDCGEGFVYDGMAKEPGVTVNFKDTTTPLPTNEYTVSYSNNIDASIGNRDGIVTIASTGTGNYTFGAGYYHFNIAPKELTMGASVTEKKYDGSTAAVVKLGALVGVVNSDDVSVAETLVSGTFNDKFVGTGKSVTLSENFTLTGINASNYTLTQPTVTGNIIAAEQEPTITATASVPRGGKTLDLSDLVSGAKGTVSFEISNGDAYATLSGSMLTTKNDVGTVKITVKIDAVDLNSDGKPEYNAYTGTDAITVSVTLKETSTVTAAPTAVPDLVYKGSDQALITAGTATGGTLYYKLNNGTYSKDLPTAKNAGDYTVYYKVVGDDDHEDSAEQSFTVTIQKATVTITARDKTAYVGGTVPVLPVKPVKDTDYTISEMYGTDTLEGNVTLTYDGTPDMSKAGSTVIKISGTLANDNYTITYVDGKLTVNRRSSGGGSSSSNSSGNTISTSGKSDNGSISTDKPTAKKGDTVTVTVTPQDGYKLDKLIVTDSKGNTLTVTDKGDNKYTFTMPSSKVTVTPTFSRIEETKPETSPFDDVTANDYFYDAVNWAADKGITGGVSSSLFAPEDGCTRAQIVTFLWRAAGSPEPKALSSFADVPADAYYAKAVAWAVENGITEGTSDTTFAPGTICTRAHGVTFLYRAAKATASAGASAFTDVADSAYYADAVKWATDNSITNGMSDGRFGPDETCTRAQIVTFLWRLYQDK